MSIQTMTIPQFLNGSYREETSQIVDRLINHLKRHKITYRIIGTSLFIFLVATDVAFAASTGIDVGGRRIYSKLLSVGRWTIILKGGFDIISNTVKGDFEYAKKSFLSYLLVYIILISLPWCLDQVDLVFKDI
jgi:hypothetical protein